MIFFSFRLELQQAREKQKEEEVEALKRSMQSGMVSIFYLILIYFSFLKPLNSVKILFSYLFNVGMFRHKQ